MHWAIHACCTNICIPMLLHNRSDACKPAALSAALPGAQLPTALLPGGVGPLSQHEPRYDDPQRKDLTQRHVMQCFTGTRLAPSSKHLIHGVVGGQVIAQRTL